MGSQYISSRDDILYSMHRPCGDCPFRTDTPCSLGLDNAGDASLGLENGDMFVCHKTVEYDPGTYNNGQLTERTQHCVGAAILLRKIGQESEQVRGMDLDMSAPVVKSLGQFIVQQARINLAEIDRERSEVLKYA